MLLSGILPSWRSTRRETTRRSRTRGVGKSSIGTKKGEIIIERVSKSWRVYTYSHTVVVSIELLVSPEDRQDHHDEIEAESTIQDSIDDPRSEHSIADCTLREVFSCTLRLVPCDCLPVEVLVADRCHDQQWSDPASMHPSIVIFLLNELDQVDPEVGRNYEQKSDDLNWEVGSDMPFRDVLHVLTWNLQVITVLLWIDLKFN